jgi:FlaA1/EpsC-like NDP-sugar epimerase/lipopolysaccharide/colanic/teichoic acid biosynthesis glycosyltransferase
MHAATAIGAPWRASYRVTKRSLDIVVALVAGVVLALPCAVIWLALRLGGVQQPVVRDRCVGVGGTNYDYLRFATERDVFDSGRSGGAGSRRMAVRLARYLRQSRLELLPALINIARGEMTFIGPRPERPEQAARIGALIPAWPLREACKPGLVSLAQVRFRYSDNLRDARVALEYDLYYLKYARIGLDLRIFGRAALLATRDWWRASARLVSNAVILGRRKMARTPVLRGATLASVPMPGSIAVGAEQLKPTLIAGAGNGGALLVQELQRNHRAGLWPVAFVDDDLAKLGKRVCGVPVLGDTSMIPSLVVREHVDTVIIAMPSAPEATIQRIAGLARETGATVRTMPGLDALLRGTPAATLAPIQMTDVLGRPVIELEGTSAEEFLRDKRVLVTGAAGSIGSELARQVAKLQPSQLLALDTNESGLFDLEHELQRIAPGTLCTPIVASITNRHRMGEIFARFRPEIVFHAAAYKHVPLMEEYPQEAIFSNSVGTYHLAKLCAAHRVERFVLVSTDKAVRPSSVMGASKRLAEIGVRAVGKSTGLSVCAVRFGNVLGSRGSVIPTFERQIAAGGPVTVTDERMKRYFMTIPEAAGLIIQAGAFGDQSVIYMLDMGEEVAIRDLAERLIRLHGFEPGKDIQIAYTGLRPGEKLREELSLDFEQARETDHQKIRILRGPDDPANLLDEVELALERIEATARTARPDQIREVLFGIIERFDGPEGLTAAQHPPTRLQPHPAELPGAQNPKQNQNPSANPRFAGGV